MLTGYGHCMIDKLQGLNTSSIKIEGGPESIASIASPSSFRLYGCCQDIFSDQLS